MIDRQHPTAMHFVNEARSRFGRLTPFRLGYVVGLSGASKEWSCPYPDALCADLFQEGVWAGEDQLTKNLERAGG